jgi:hypothetical protein
MLKVFLRVGYTKKLSVKRKILISLDLLIIFRENILNNSSLILFSEFKFSREVISQKSY